MKKTYSTGGNDCLVNVARTCQCALLEAGCMLKLSAYMNECVFVCMSVVD